MQFVQSPQEPVATSSQWVNWVRSASGSSPLQRLVGNAAYLVRVDTTVASYSWNVQGRPVAPSYQWTTSGLNFLGFPTVPVNPPMMVSFLPSALRTGPDAQIFQYVGGNLGTTNPARVYAVNTTPVGRGQAFWIRSGNVYNRYFAPFEVALAGEQGVDFGANRSASTFRLRNLTAGALTVTLQLAASETPPVGQSNIVGVPPLLLRGSLNITNLTYGYTNLPVNTPRTWTLAGQGLPGSEVEVVLGLDRIAMGGNVGDLRAGILHFTDSLGHARVDVPVSATVASNTGLWVGGATVSQVSQYLKTYARDSENKPITTTNGITRSPARMRRNFFACRGWIWG